MFTLLAQSLDTLYAPGSLVGGQNVTLASFLSPLISNVSIIAGIASFVTILLAGFRYITAAGNEKETAAASQMLSFALIGLILSILAFWITRILFSAFGPANLF